MALRDRSKHENRTLSRGITRRQREGKQKRKEIQFLAPEGKGVMLKTPSVIHNPGKNVGKWLSGGRACGYMASNNVGSGGQTILARGGRPVWNSKRLGL